MVQVRDNLGLGTVSSVGELPSDGSEYLARGLQDATSTASRVARLMQDENIRKRNAQFNNKRLDNDRALNTASVEGIRVAAEAPDFAVQDFETVEAAFLKNFEERHRALKQAMGLQGSLEEEQIDADYDVKKQFALGVLKQQHDAAVFDHRDGVLNQAFEDSLEGLRQAPENLVAALETQSAKLESFRHDMTEEEFRTRSRSETAAHLATAVGSYIERGDYGAARQLLAGTDPKTGSHIPVGLYLDEGDVQSLGETVRQLEQEDERDRRQDAETQRVLENSLSAEDAKRQIRETVAAEDREEVERRVAEQQELLEASERRESQRFANEMWERSWTGAIPPLVWRGMPAELQQAIRKDRARVRRMQAEDPSYDHSARASFPETLREIRNYDAEAFKTLDLTPYRGALSEADYSGFAQEQRDLRQGKVNPDARQDLFDEVVGLYRNQFRHMAHEADNFERQMEAFRAQEAREGRPINRADLLKRARELQPGLTGELGFREEDFLSEAEKVEREKQHNINQRVEKRHRAQTGLARVGRGVTPVPLEEAQQNFGRYLEQFRQANGRDATLEEIDHLLSMHGSVAGSSRPVSFLDISGDPQKMQDYIPGRRSLETFKALIPNLSGNEEFYNETVALLEDRGQELTVGNVAKGLEDIIEFNNIPGGQEKSIRYVISGMKDEENKGLASGNFEQVLESYRLGREIGFDWENAGKQEIEDLIRNSDLPERWKRDTENLGLVDSFVTHFNSGDRTAKALEQVLVAMDNGDFSRIEGLYQTYLEEQSYRDSGGGLKANVVVPFAEWLGENHRDEAEAAGVAALAGLATFGATLYTAHGSLALGSFAALNAYKATQSLNDYKKSSAEFFLELHGLMKKEDFRLDVKTARGISYGIGLMSGTLSAVSFKGVSGGAKKLVQTGLVKAVRENERFRKALVKIGDLSGELAEGTTKAMIVEVSKAIATEFGKHDSLDAAAVKEALGNIVVAIPDMLDVATDKAAAGMLNSNLGIERMLTPLKSL